MILELYDPENDWPTYSISIVSQYFDDYASAVCKEKELFISASESEKTPPRQKKNYKRKIMIHHNNVESDESDCLQLTPVKISKTVNTNITSCPLNTASEPYYNTVVHEPSIGNSTTTLMSLDNLKMTDKSENSGENAILTLDNTMSYVPFNTYECNTNSDDIYKKLLEIQMTTLDYVKRIDAKLERMEIKLNNGSPINNIHDEEFLSIFPFKTIESIITADERLKTEEKFERQLVDTAINTFQAKESDFENHVKDWFRHALQRFKREEKIKI
ncbi:unnamed protein product [Macrosiphum euphorbiae]|uniref:Uncharacterized protein n=1 Tax=Macrosiphum euphorbiae TaxID=13131 RepID=A0AAV0WIN5_9HEMI|nr:unnamed protein product [Macrosiphum euphorbiae]